jgi:DNA-binding NarL/FixJ family response regulator
LDDHWITRTALHAALASVSDVKITEVAADCDELIETMSNMEQLPDVLVLTGANEPTVVLPRLAELLPYWPIRVLMLGGERFPDPLNRCTTAGWLPQSATEQEFVAAVRLIAAGHWIVPQPDDSVGFISPGEPVAALDEHELTVRELEVLRLLARGHTNAEISLRLQLGQSTVKSHVQKVLTKIGVRNRVRAAIYAYETGLLRPGIATASGRGLAATRSCRYKK